MDEAMISIWKVTGWAIVVSIFCLIVVYPLVTTKEFKGYYLSHSAGGPYTIWINWENRADESAFKTYNKDELLEVYAKLQSEQAQR